MISGFYIRLIVFLKTWLIQFRYDTPEISVLFYTIQACLSAYAFTEIVFCMKM